MRTSGFIANGIPILFKVLIKEIYDCQVLTDTVMILGQLKGFTLAEGIHQ